MKDLLATIVVRLDILQQWGEEQWQDGQQQQHEPSKGSDADDVPASMRSASSRAKTQAFGAEGPGHDLFS